LQPLDVAIIGPFKQKVYAAIDSFRVENGDIDIRSTELAQILILLNRYWDGEEVECPISLATKRDNCISAFRATGIWPIDRSIDEGKFTMNTAATVEVGDSSEESSSSDEDEVDLTVEKVPLEVVKMAMETYRRLGPLGELALYNTKDKLVPVTSFLTPDDKWIYEPKKTFEETGVDRRRAKRERTAAEKATEPAKSAKTKKKSCLFHVAGGSGVDKENEPSSAGPSTAPRLVAALLNLRIK
jgi:hypothetical protein